MVKFGKMGCILALTSLLVAPAIAQEGPTVIENGWMVTTLDEFSKPIYSRNGCVIRPLPDDGGMVIQVFDANWNGVNIVQNIFISKVEGDPYKISSHIVFGYQNFGSSTLYVVEGIDTIIDLYVNIDVFETNCIGIAQRLPEKVQAAFLGYYGLGQSESLFGTGNFLSTE